MRHAGGVLSASALNSGVAFVVTVAAAAVLPVERFGELALALALVTVLAALTDLGSGLALVRHAGRDPASMRSAATAAVLWKLAACGALVTTAMLLPDATLAAAVPLLAGDRVLAAATGLGAGVLGLWSTVRALDQAREDFATLDRTLLACALLRAAAFTGLVITGNVTPVTVVLSLYVVPLALLLAARLRPARAPWMEVRQAARSLARYGAWVGASAACFVAFTRAPLLIVGHGGDAVAAGVLGAAMTCVLACSLLGEALRTVALPRIVRARDAGERSAIRAWLARTARPVLLLGAVATLLFAAAYETLLGSAHAGGAFLFAVLGLATLLAADLGLRNALLHAHGRPDLDLGVNVLRLLVLAALAAVLPPTPVAIAVAYATVLVGGELALRMAVRRLERAGGAPHLAAEPTR